MVYLAVSLSDSQWASSVSMTGIVRSNVTCAETCAYSSDEPVSVPESSTLPLIFPPIAGVSLMPGPMASYSFSLGATAMPISGVRLSSPENPALGHVVSLLSLPRTLAYPLSLMLPSP